MNKGLNKVFLLGRLGQDPDVRATNSGLSIATISIATNRSVKNKETNEYNDVTDWHRVVFFGKLAEIVEKYLKRGSQIYVEGRLQTRTWEANGEKKYITEVVANEMQMLGGKSEISQSMAGNEKSTAAPPKPPSAAPPEQGYDNDIPF